MFGFKEQETVFKRNAKDEDAPTLKEKEIILSTASLLANQYTARLPSTKQLQMEIQHFDKKIKQGELENKQHSDLTIFWMEIVTRKDQFRIGTGMLHYEPPIDVRKIDKYHLIKLFQVWKGFSWIRNFGWIGQLKNSIQPDIAEFQSYVELFEGVKVLETDNSTENIVNEINFSGYGCVGKFTHNLGEIKNLESIIMDHNPISGDIPDNFDNLVNLQKLSFVGCLLTGKITAKVFSCYINITTLNLSFNSMHGEIPDIFHVSPHLTDINLAGNKFTGEIPSSFGSLKQLKTLKLYHNNFTGIIPMSFKELTNLTEINLSKNRLIGGIENLFNNLSLISLILHSNSITEDLPLELCHLTSLVTLHLQNNQFVGIFHKEWSNLMSLKWLNLSNNRLYGVIPEEIGLLDKLETLNLANNQFVGPIPKALAKLIKLHDFSLLSNYSSESFYIPREFKKTTFQRIYKMGPSLDIDNIHWKTNDSIDTSMIGNPFHKYHPEKSKSENHIVRKTV